MKEATGELSMTVIVIIGAIVIAGIIYALSPSLKTWIENKWNGMDQAACTQQGCTWTSGSCTCNN